MDETNGHVMRSVQSFCNLYTTNSNDFSVDGRKWLNAVRICFLVKLVPLIRPYITGHLSCQELDNYSLRTHNQCYFRPYWDRSILHTAPTICQISQTDWGKAFWTIRGGLHDVNVHTLKGMLNVMNRCNGSVLNGFLNNNTMSQDSGMRLVKLTIRISELGDKMMDTETTSISIAQQLAQQFNWEQHGLQWFAFTTNDTDMNLVSFKILLGSRRIFDVKVVDAPEANIADMIDCMVTAIGNRRIFLNVGDGLAAVMFSGCLDFDCTNTYFNVSPRLQATSVDAVVHCESCCSRVFIYCTSIVFLGMLQAIFVKY